VTVEIYEQQFAIPKLPLFGADASSGDAQVHTAAVFEEALPAY